MKAKAKMSGFVGKGRAVVVVLSPGGNYLVRRVNPKGETDVDEARTILVQSDWDFPGLARMFGWVACPCGATDGTVDCDHRTASEMIQEAQQVIDANLGLYAEDPGYF